ncbi:hypothetical protein EVAR_61189_1 [Eumeta japonica]|uniref:Uncharacterized protein n=1 Tax=Eumeta variegata TaxID=151549 RepID=A0A4C1YU36_EUMVA|nr:hypothetical protein EVAR_61189_1 [Eumeta japonica]
MAVHRYARIPARANAITPLQARGLRPAVEPVLLPSNKNNSRPSRKPPDSGSRMAQMALYFETHEFDMRFVQITVYAISDKQEGRVCPLRITRKSTASDERMKSWPDTAPNVTDIRQYRRAEARGGLPAHVPPAYVESAHVLHMYDERIYICIYRYALLYECFSIS